MPNLTNIKAWRPFVTPTVIMVFLGLLVLLVNSSFKSKHPYYVGLTEISYTGKPDLQISVRVFSNDLEDALSKNAGKKIDLLNPKDKAATDTIVATYIKKRLGILYNGKKTSLNFIGYEREEESVWIYMDIKKAAIPKTIVVTNTVLYDYLPQQTNIIRVNRLDVTQSKKLNNPDNKAEFNF